VLQSITSSKAGIQRVLVAMMVIGLAMRLGWALSRPADESYLAQLPDQLEYLELGRNLAFEGSLKFFDSDFQDTVFAFRTPGYPALVAAFRGNITAIRIAQALIDTSTILAAFVLARRWLPRGVSTFAAALVAFNPFLIFFCALVLSETLFTSMLCWGMALIAIGRPSERKWSWVTWWAGAGVLVLSILVRPSAVLLPVMLGIVATIANRGVSPPYLSKWVPPVATTMVGLTLAVLLPWGLRNYRVLGSWVFTTTNSGITLYDGFNPDATGASNQAFVRMLPQLRGMNELQRSEYLSREARRYIRSDPRRAAELAAVKMARTWSPVPLSETYSSRRNRLLAASYMIPFYVLVIVGLWLGRPSLSAKVFLLLPAIYFTVAHAVSVGSLRYRVPSDVPMAIVAAMGASRMSDAALRRSGPGTAASSPVL
jgi:hypothetical protein